MNNKASLLSYLEEEAIFLFREVVSQCKKPVLLYSIGKDSTVLVHLARKAFFPSKLPFPLLHIDTTWKFKEMIAFRDNLASAPDISLIVHTNQEGMAQGISPFTHSPSLYTQVMKTQALREALELHGFDAAFGGARRDEDPSRAKERMVSVRTQDHAWDPKTQPMEAWKLFPLTTQTGSSFRIFPLSNWTEADVWRYIIQEKLDVVPLYFAKNRTVVHRNGHWILVDDNRFPLKPGEEKETRKVRLRTLGCYPLSGALESDAQTLEEVLEEITRTATQERGGRLIDHDLPFAMERKKREGYF